MALIENLPFASLNKKLKGDGGFTLVEVIVSAGISCFVLLAVASLMIDNAKVFKRFEAQAYMAESMQFTVSPLMHLLETAGGNGITAGQSVKVENNCASRYFFPNCQGSDRLNFITLKIDPTTQNPYTPLTVNVYDPILQNLKIQLVAAVCPTLSTYMNKVLAINDNDNIKISYVTDFDQGNCVLTLQDSKIGSIFTTTPPNHNLMGFTVSIINLWTYYWDPAAKSLLRVRDLNNSGGIDAGEQSTMQTGVYDFQVALGFDFSPKDGSVTDTNSNTDEWLYNVGSEQITDPFFANVTPRDLQMVRIAIAVGTKAVDVPSGDFNLLDGPTRNNPEHQLIRKIYKEIMFKNEIIL